MNRIIYLLLAAYLIKQVLWSALVPVFHFPDEQAHLAQVSYIAETGRQVPYLKNDLTEEIRKTEELLGTERDKVGNNRFTFHPEYRLEYTSTKTGKDESLINSLATDLNNRKFVRHEASRYPELYYRLLSYSYGLFYGQSLLVRLFVMRLSQLFFGMLTVYFAYLIGKSVLNSEFSAVSLAALVSFHPMFSFVSSGINSDNIGNMAFTGYLAFAAAVFNQKKKPLNYLLLFFFIILSLYAKPQFFIVIPLTFILAVIIGVSSLKRISDLFKYSILIIILSAITFIIIAKMEVFPHVLLARLFTNFSIFEFINYIRSYIIGHLYHEVMPWYWGVFDWLGVTYPRFVHRIINWINLVSLAGVFVWFTRIYRTKTARQVLFLIITVIFLISGIYFYDYTQYSESGFHLGVQGRYFFPVITIHMLLLLKGIESLASDKFKILAVKLLILFFSVFQFYALFFVSSLYFHLWPVNKFILEASQYKPWFFKGVNLAGLVIITLITNIVFLLKYFRGSYYEKNGKK